MASSFLVPPAHLSLRLCQHAHPDVDGAVASRSQPAALSTSFREVGQAGVGKLASVMLSVNSRSH